MADIVLLYNDYDKEVADRVVKLKRGEAFAFEGTMVEVGKRGAAHVMSLWELHSYAETSNGRVSWTGKKPEKPVVLVSGGLGDGDSPPTLVLTENRQARDPGVPSSS